jgi:diguanylate cyclase (GGDEF)-like protein
LSLLKQDSLVWKNIIILSLVNLAGMVILMGIIFWLMFDDVTEERKNLIRAQVETAISLTEKIYLEYEQGLIPEAEARQKVLTFLSSLRYPGSGYFWVLDNDGVMLMHPYNPKLIGKNLWDLKDSRGHFFVREQISAAQAGGGFNFYEWPRPTSTEPETKIAYVAMFKPWKWFIGSGNYIDDLRQAAWSRTLYGSVFILILFCIHIAVSLYLSRRYMKKFRDSAIHDALTGLHSRRYLDEIGTRLLQRSAVEGAPRLAAIFFDIDHFKRVNDSFGHKIGDRVLHDVGQLIKQQLRPNEMPFRYGGEEFVLMIYATEENSRNIAERIRKAIKQHLFTFSKHEFNVTISAGVAVNRDDETLIELLRRADRCMYAAKENGRDCIVTESQIAISDDTSITITQP